MFLQVCLPLPNIATTFQDMPGFYLENPRNSVVFHALFVKVFFVAHLRAGASHIHSLKQNLCLLDIFEKDYGIKQRWGERVRRRMAGLFLINIPLGMKPKKCFCLKDVTKDCE